MIKKTDNHPGGRVSLRQDLWKGDCSSHALSHGTALAAAPCDHQTRSSLKNIPLGFLWRVHQMGRHDWSLTAFPAHLPLWRMGGRAENSKLLIMALSFRWPAPIQEPTKTHLIRTKDTPITQEIPEDLGALWQEPGSKANYENKRCSCALIT